MFVINLAALSKCLPLLSHHLVTFQNSSANEVSVFFKFRIGTISCKQKTKLLTDINENVGGYSIHYIFNIISNSS